ncbi:hypothetical protein [Mycolicibacterium porcinum]|uniref:Twin-arginine translocation pathway signal n=1 Tax=Mycolicibacterium porcinum TaxID=39693 RepID=A0AAW5T297_9MYCO|nr:hypothetical protein [Mycolicibacterium porcinum]MCV7388384.1 hypothetical protein [Mycolicibacterium porcinum]CDO32437.1 Mce associated membrane protein [Mycolicibacterium vulneris]
MSGRHKMPPAGRRKAAAQSAETTEQTTSPEPEIVEDTSAAETTGTEETAAVEAAAEDTEDTADAVAVEPGPEPEPAGSDEPAESAAADDEPDEPVDAPAETEPARGRSRVSVPVVLAAVALVLAVTCAVLRWLIVAQDQSDTARDEAVQAAKEITAEMLSYETETVDQQLTAARDRMTGEFLGKYSAMINEVVPAAHAQQIAAVAEVLRAGVVSAKPDSAELVLFVNQSVQVGNNMPQKTASVARATLVKEGDRWMLSKYEPVPL